MPVPVQRKGPAVGHGDGPVISGGCFGVRQRAAIAAPARHRPVGRLAPRLVLCPGTAAGSTSAQGRANGHAEQ